jgi:outer membrane receptor protein involved in Fe transport
LRYRGRLGWTGQGLTVSGFVNMIPHNGQGGNPPPACFWSNATNPATGAQYKAGDCYPGSPYWGPYPVFPGLHYGDLYTFDASVAYQTGTTPASEYLRNINIQFTVNNLTNRRPPFAYSFGSGRGTAAAVNVIDPRQRYLSLAVTKYW